MGDVYPAKKRSEVMSKIRSTNTKPEIIVRKHLFSKGLRFRIHQKNLPGSPDIVLKCYNTIVLVNGCFWHGHTHCDLYRMPSSNLNYWEPKIARNIDRDLRNKRDLRKLGWKLIVVWECQLKKSVKERTLKKIIARIIK